MIRKTWATLSGDNIVRRAISGRGSENPLWQEILIDAAARTDRIAVHHFAHCDHLLAGCESLGRRQVMFAAHFAAGLALRGRAPRVPLSVLLLGAFLLDGLWVTFGVLHLDKTSSDDWSHSLVMSICWATAFSLLFSRLGRKATAVVWLAVFSHFVLDWLVQGATLYPNAPESLAPLVVQHYRILQLAICILLLGVYVRDARRNSLPVGYIAAVCGTVLVLNARYWFGV
jgi:hypothetical protein